ncbi:hypothetical protein KCU90_g214, partial [Aureobasidium melanogenum]
LIIEPPGGITRLAEGGLFDGLGLTRFIGRGDDGPFRGRRVEHAANREQRKPDICNKIVLASQLIQKPRGHSQASRRGTSHMKTLISHLLCQLDNHCPAGGNTRLRSRILLNMVD